MAHLRPLVMSLISDATAFGRSLLMAADAAAARTAMGAAPGASAGLLAARPTASASTLGSTYLGTDTGVVYLGVTDGAGSYAWLPSAIALDGDPAGTAAICDGSDGLTRTSAAVSAVLAAANAAAARTALGAETAGAAAAVTTTSIGAVPTSTLTTRGDLLRRGASAAERVALGAAGTRLRSDGTDPVWSEPDVVCTYAELATTYAPSAVLRGVIAYTSDTLATYVCRRTATSTYAWAYLASGADVAAVRTSLVADASAWADASADWRISALAYGATSCPNSRTPGTYDLVVPSGGSYNAQQRLATLDVAGRFSGGWQVVDTGTVQAGGAVLPVMGAGASGDRLEPAGAFTVLAWVTPLYTNTGSTITRYAVTKRRDDATWSGGVFSALQLGIEGASDGRPYVLLRDGSTDRQIDAARPLPLGRLTQLAVTLSGATGTATLWIDGVSQGTIAVTSGMTWGTGTVRSWCLGANGYGATPTWAQEWPGWLGRVGVWSRALSAAELLDDVRAVKG